MISIGAIRAQSGNWRLHSCKPDSSQRGGNLFGIELLIFFSAKEFLNQEVIYHHAEEPTGRQQRINLAKLSPANTFTDVAAQGLVVVGHKSPEETFGKRVVFQCREPQQPGQFGVMRCSNQKFARHGSEDLEIIAAALENLVDAPLPSPCRALFLDDGPVQVLLAGEVAKQERLVDSGPFGNLARGRPLITLAGKQADRNRHDLLAAILG